MNPEAVLACHDVTRQFQMADQVVTVLRGVNLVVLPGEMVSIVGTSGSGKTTLLNLLAGLDDPTTGEVAMVGEVISKLSANKRAALRNRCLGFVFQFHHLLPEFSALENVLMPCRINGKPSQSDLDYGRQLLSDVGLAARLHHRPAELSGGERQRVALARALIHKPAFLLLDEPTGNLDEASAEGVQQLITRLNATTQASFISVTHNLEWARQHGVQYRLIKGQLERIG